MKCPLLGTHLLFLYRHIVLPTIPCHISQQFISSYRQLQLFWILPFLFSSRLFLEAFLFYRSIYSVLFSELRLPLQVLIWDVRCWNDEDNQQKFLHQSRKFNGAEDNTVPLTWTVEPLQELLGHEGSIYRISWSGDGLCVASASDDRRSVMLFEPLLYGRLMITSGFYDKNMITFFASNCHRLFIFLSTWFTRNYVHRTDFLSRECTFCSLKYGLLISNQVYFHI